MNIVSQNISAILWFITFIAVIRLSFSLFKPMKNKIVYGLLVLAVFASSFVFFNEMLAIWNTIVISGLLFSCTTFEKEGNNVLKYIMNIIAFILVSCGIVGMHSPKYPIISMGPSMWPSSPKTPSVDFLDKSSYKEDSPSYGDDIFFKVPETSNSQTIKDWPAGRYRKRIWALPGDEIKIIGNSIYLNNDVIADCKDRDRRVDVNIWLCEVNFPNGKKIDITWGISNQLVFGNIYRKLENNEYFAVGDNTVESDDSRYFKSINGSWIQGKFKDKNKEPTLWVPWI